MALNREHAGYFGNYYMYHNNSYVPFTWLLQLYAWWSELGTAPVLQRVPSLFFAIITWLGVRGAVGPVAVGKRLLVPALLFLTWWLPFGLGTRQEASVSACLTITVCAMLLARRSATGRVPRPRRRRGVPRAHRAHHAASSCCSPWRSGRNRRRS